MFIMSYEQKEKNGKIKNSRSEFVLRLKDNTFKTVGHIYCYRNTVLLIQLDFQEYKSEINPENLSHVLVYTENKKIKLLGEKLKNGKVKESGKVFYWKENSNVLFIKIPKTFWDKNSRKNLNLQYFLKFMGQEVSLIKVELFFEFDNDESIFNVETEDNFNFLREPEIQQEISLDELEKKLYFLDNDLEKEIFPNN